MTIIIPVLNEAGIIHDCLEALQRGQFGNSEIIVVDGGSVDNSAEIAFGSVDSVVVGPSGRAAQMNAGARMATGDYLLFLHVDTRLPYEAADILTECIRQGVVWGRFDVCLSGVQRVFRVVEYCMNLRSRLSGIATGDQAIFVRRDVFENLGGYPEIPIMEDIALSKALNSTAKPRCLRQRVVTSSRRWEQNGPFRTILFMWVLRLLYFLGVPPWRLAQWYR